MKSVFIFLSFLLTGTAFSQEEPKDLPYFEIPNYPENYTAGTVAARMVDALGFRFYWASDSLTESDLSYRANEDGRSSVETIEHIYDLSRIIVNSTLMQPNLQVKEDFSYREMREKTLTNLKTAADILRLSNDISKFKIIFGDQEIPFWNQFNGPIADAIWHCGQLVIYRRASGNPINSKVNHFTGKVKS